nr:multicopper oxidase domain-containing protein [Paludisphaera mucosa]
MTDKDQNIRPVLNTTEVWTLTVAPPPEGSTGPDNHPFHLHVNPFQILSVTTADGRPLDPANGKDWLDLVGQWKDTILISSDVKVTVGTRFGDWPGKTVMHCHILDHEDQGMMKTFEILDAAGQPAAPGKAQRLDRVDEAAPRIVLTDTSGTRRELAKGGPRPTVALFFRGLQCSHCSKQLREFVEAASAKLDGRVTILALSDRPLKSPRDAMRRVGATDAVDFHFVEDSRREAFAQYGCMGETPLHGLFVIDTEGRVRLRYVGEEPYAETGRVIREIEALFPTPTPRGDSGGGR